MTRGLATFTGLAIGLTGAVAFGLAPPAAAAPAYPAPDGRCVDQTGVLGPHACARITAVLLQDEDATSDEIAVAVVPTTGDASIESWSTGLFNAWGVGKKGKDNGVLLVVAIDDHRVRLETGRGMDDRLSDAQAGEIVNATITPKFVQGEYAAGILAGLDEIRRRVGHAIPAGGQLISLLPVAGAPSGGSPAGGGHPPPAHAPASDSPDSSGLAWLLFPAGVFVILVLAFWRHDRRRGLVFGRHNSGQYVSSGFWGGDAGSSGSSGSGFGGGGSDGGGASGSW